MALIKDEASILNYFVVGEGDVMRKAQKLLYCILLLGLFVTLAFVFIENQRAVGLPLRFTPIYDYPLVGRYMVSVLFWLSALFLALTIVLLLTVIFYPKKSSTLTIHYENGNLNIQKKAIENFVLKIVKKEPFISNPSVKVKMYPKKIRIKIRGVLRQAMSVPEKQQSLVDEVKKEVSALMGTTANIKTEVYLQDLANKAKKKIKVE